MKKIIILLALAVALMAVAAVSYKIPVVRDTVASMLPLDLKVKIKRTLFPGEYVAEQLAVQQSQYAALEERFAKQQTRAAELAEDRFFADLSVGATASWPVLSKVLSQSRMELVVHRSRDESIQASDNTSYWASHYALPFLPTGLQYGYKPLFFVDSSDTHLYLITGDGTVLHMAVDGLSQPKATLISIPTNVRKLIRDERFYAPSWFSVKDMKIHGDYLYFSYTKKVGELYTLSIMRAELNNEQLEFEEFFTLDDPVEEREPFNAHQIGGRLVAFSDKELLMSTGDFRKYEKAQDENSLLGKIFSINLESKQTTLISKGHRNVQGLSYDPANKVVVSTEHGPNGGDEINVNRLSAGGELANFGWPQASYGLHYDSRFHPEAPLHKSHSEHGYLEPLKHYTPSVGISEIVKLPKTFAQGFNNDYFAATMGLNPSLPIFSLHHFRLDSQSRQIETESIIKIGERIRDVEVLDAKRVVMALEGNGTPAIGVLRFYK